MGRQLVQVHLQVNRPEVCLERDRPLAMVRQAEGALAHSEHPWVLLVPVSVRQARWGRGLHRQVRDRRVISGLRGRGQTLREPERFRVRV